MKQNNIALMLGIFTVLLFSFSSAAFSVVGDSTGLSQADGSVIVTLTNQDSGNSSSVYTIYSPSDISDGKGNTISFTVSPSTLTLENGTGDVFTVSYDIDSHFNFTYGKTYSSKLIVSEDYNGTGTITNKSLIFSFEPSYWGEECENGSCDQSYLKVTEFDWAVDEGIGDEDYYFYPLDEISFEFDVENSRNSNVENIELDVCVYDVDNDKCIFTEKDLDLSYDDFDLEDESVTISGTLYLDADELKSGSEDYILLITAKGKVDDEDNADDGNYTYGCFAKDFEIKTGTEYLIFSELDVVNYLVEEGDTVTLEGKLWNIGDKDIKEEDVFVHVWSEELGLDDVVSFDEDFNDMDYQEFSYSFDLPETLEGGYYQIRLDIYDDDRMWSSDLYSISGDVDADANYIYILEVQESPKDPTIDASYAEGSSSVVGKKMEVIASLTNEKDDSETYTLSVTDYADWAELISITPQEAILASGETGEYEIVFKATQSGTHTFKIKAVDSEGNINYITREVTVAEGFFGSIEGDTTTYIVAGALGILILFLLILIIVASAKKKRRAVAH